MANAHPVAAASQTASIAPSAIQERGTALAEYVADVRGGAFPEEQHTYAIPDDELARFEEALSARE